MDYATLKKLSQNPHYKLSDAQKAKLAEYEQPAIVVFETVNMHENTFKKHNTRIRKIKK